MKLIPGILVLLLALHGIPVSAQNDSTFLSRAAGSLSEWAYANPIEKVHLQLDKPCYAAGDDIWFKAYITAGAKHRLSAVSGILNVELINHRNLIEQSVKLPIVIG